jgi:quercetin dioxygenase-like cupin family protein
VTTEEQVVSKRTTQTARIEDLVDERGWSPIRLRLDVRAFGINGWTAKEAGDAVIPEHDEVPSGHEELYLVTAGHATFTVDGEQIDAPSGAIVFVPDPAVKRGAVAREPATTVLAIGGTPGEAYQPRAWETNAEVLDLFDRGDHAAAKRVLSAALEEYSDHDLLHYNLACAEAQLGNLDAAFDHLRAALDHRPELAESARTDHDLESLHDDPRFGQIVG